MTLGSIKVLQDEYKARGATARYPLDDHFPIPLRSITSTRNNKRPTPDWIHPNDEEMMDHCSHKPMPHRRSSPSIAIKKNSEHGSSSGFDSFGSHMDAVETDEYSFSYHERLYDSATWRMYQRIVDHRRIQQSFLRSDSQDSFNILGTGSSSRNAGHYKTIEVVSFPTTSGGRIDHDHPQTPNTSSLSCSSSVVSMGDDEVFEMEL